MKDLYNWLVTSSADPLKTSTAVKGALKIVLAQVVQAVATTCALGIFCLPGGAEGMATQAIEFIGQAIAAILTLWGVGQGLYGLYRKAKLGRWSAA